MCLYVWNVCIRTSAAKEAGRLPEKQQHIGGKSKHIRRASLKASEMPTECTDRTRIRLKKHLQDHTFLQILLGGFRRDWRSDQTLKQAMKTNSFIRFPKLRATKHLHRDLTWSVVWTWSGHWRSDCEVDLKLSDYFWKQMRFDLGKTPVSANRRKLWPMVVRACCCLG